MFCYQSWKNNRTEEGGVLQLGALSTVKDMFKRYDMGKGAK